MEHDDQLAYAGALTDAGQHLMARGDLTASAACHTEAGTLLRTMQAGPSVVDLLVRSLTGQGDLLRMTGDLHGARACLDEAAQLGGDATRQAELANVRALVAASAGEWATAEDVATAALTTAPAEVETYLLTTLGLVCASTGRFDDAEDYFARALEARDDESEPPELMAHRAYVAMRRGRLDPADELYAAAAALCADQGRLADLAVCEQARGMIAALRGNPAEADTFLARSLAKFEELGHAIAAADTMLVASQQAYGRGDIAEMRRLSEGARAVYEAQGVFERCAQADFLTAASIEEGLNRDAYGEHEREAVDAALALALPAALALTAARCDFATGHARTQWLALADDATRLAFRLAVRRQDQGLLFELVEFRCAGVPLALGGTGLPAAAATAPTWHEAPLLGDAMAELVASEGFRVSLPPKVLMSPGTDRTALQEYIAAAEERYRRRVTSDEAVPSW